MPGGWGILEQYGPRQKVTNRRMEDLENYVHRLAKNSLQMDNAGNVDIIGVINIGTAGGIFQGTGTFASPTTGLKISNSGGIGLLEMWGSGTKQAYMDTDGKLYAGAGTVLLDSTGGRVIATPTALTSASLRVSKDSSTDAFGLTIIRWGSLSSFYTPMIASLNEGTWDGYDLGIGGWHASLLGAGPNFKAPSIGINASTGDVSVFGNLDVGNSATTRSVSLYGSLDVKSGSGQAMAIKTLTELTTINAAATTDTAIQIPANALVVAVSVRVTVIIPTATTFDVGVAGATTRYGTGLSTAADTTSPGTLDSVRYYAAAAAIRITPNLVPADNSGRVRVTIHYLEITAPTS